MKQMMKCILPLMMTAVFAVSASAAEKKAKSNTMTHEKVARLIIVQLGGEAPASAQEAFAWLINRNVTPLFGWGFGAKPKDGEKPDPSVLCTKADLAVLLVRSMGLQDSLDPKKDLATSAVEVLAAKGISVSELGGETAIKEVAPAPGGPNVNDEAVSSDPIKKNDITKPSDSTGDGTNVSNAPFSELTADELTSPAPADVITSFFPPREERDDDREPTS